MALAPLSKAKRAARPGDAQLPVIRQPTAPLVAVIDQRLRAMLVDGTLASGGKLNELALAQQMQVSRSALREAVRRLEQSGLVTIIPNRGVFVRSVGLQDILDLFDVHAGLARSAGRLLAQRASADQVRHLEACQADMAAALAAEEVGRYRDLNGDFHRDLFEFARNSRLTALHGMIASELQLSRRHNLGTLHQLRASLTEHNRILEALKARDETRTARSFEQHVLAGKRRMVESVTVQATE
jgi:DNA-binding GntR family transcriptional regulator